MFTASSVSIITVQKLMYQYQIKSTGIILLQQQQQINFFLQKQKK